MNAALLFFIAAQSLRPFPSMSESMRPYASMSSGMGGDVGGPAVTIDAQPFTRTVTCSDYTLTGTAPGAGAVTWAASPSGDSGACTGTTSWSCVVNVDPNAVGEGVEVITVTQGVFTDTETIGFYVDGEHSCFLAQSYDGAYNAGKADLAAVATWVNLGSSALDVTQGVGSAQPTYRTGIVGGQPVVRCDGGDKIAATTAADWTFVANGTTTSTEVLWIQTVAASTFYSPIGTARLAAAGRGFSIAMNDSTVNEGHRTYTWNGANTITFSSSVANVMPAGKFSIASMQIFIDAGGVDLIQYTNAVSTATSEQTFSVAAPSSALTICSGNNSGSDEFPITGDIFRAIIYSGTLLDATQRGINKAVDEWALGGSLPVTP